MITTVISLGTPKLIRHEQFTAALGYPVSLHLDAQRLCVAVSVSDPYYQGHPVVEYRIPGGINEAAILAAVAAHVPGPAAVAPPTKEQILEARLLALEAKTKALEAK